jgi:PEP-CTERM motif
MTSFLNHLVITLVVAGSLMVGMTSAQATALAPGGTVAPAAVPNPVPTLLADTGLETFSFGSPLSSGTVREIVVADAGNPFGAGKLSFVYQFRDATGDVGRITGSSFAGFLTDVGVNLPIAPFFTSGTALPSTIDRSSGVGDVIGFNFIPPVTPDSGSADTSFELIIRTNATTFGAGSIGIIDGGGQTLAGFAPTGSTTAVPEPASIVLLSLGAAGIWGFGRKRRT